MAAIRPSSDLRNSYNDISEFCHTYREPVFITKNGTGDLVVMSNEEYERLSSAYDLRRLLDEGLSALSSGKRKSAAKVFADLERRMGIAEA